MRRKAKISPCKKYSIRKSYLKQEVIMNECFCGVFSSTSFYTLFVSLQSHVWLIHFFPPTPALSTISRPLSSSMCSITPETANVCRSYNRMRGPGIDCWFSYRSNCSHWSFEAAVLPISPNIYTDQWEPIVMYNSITFTFTGPYTTMQPTLLTSWLQLLSYKV